MEPDTAARRNGGYESGDGPLPDPELLPTGPAPGAQKATATAAICRHCGDHTDPDDDPAPDLCAMCAKAGRTSATAATEVLTNEQLDERIKRLMLDISARQPELADALEDAVWLRYGIDL